RDAVLCIVIAAALLVICNGDGLRGAAEDMHKSAYRTVLLAIAKPAGAIADALPFASITDQVTGWLSPDENLSGGGGSFTRAPGTSGGVGSVSPDAFSPQQLGLHASLPPLRSVLVTGDSMVQPLDAY